MQHLFLQQAASVCIQSDGGLPVAIQSSHCGAFLALPQPSTRPQGHWERPPYDNSSMRSAYHVRELDVYRLLQIHRHLDVFLSHDWPRGIAHHGNKSQLFRAKPFLQREVSAALFWSHAPRRVRVAMKALMSTLSDS